jgi:hypothetical protein
LENTKRTSKLRVLLQTPRTTSRPLQSITFPKSLEGSRSNPVVPRSENTNIYFVSANNTTYQGGMRREECSTLSLGQGGRPTSTPCNVGSP